MAKAVELTELAELGIDVPNMLHIQESYLRQIAHAKPFTAKKKTKAEVAMTTAKWFRQKGTGRARQGARSNPHLHGGGRAFPPHARVIHMKLNKHVRQSALRSAVLCHIQDGSAWMIQGADFDSMIKTRQVAEILTQIGSGGSICLVLKRGTPVWLGSRNIFNVCQIAPDQMNVRDLAHSECLVFSESALAEYRELLKRNLVPEGSAGATEDEEPVAVADTSKEDEQS